MHRIFVYNCTCTSKKLNSYLLEPQSLVLQGIPLLQPHQMSRIIESVANWIPFGWINDRNGFKIVSFSHQIGYLRFYVPLKNFSLIWRRHHCREGLQNLSLCSALRAFEQGGIFIVPHLLWHGASIFPVSSEGPPHLVAFYDTRGDAEDLF
jgi:hypothetical protein